MIVKLTPEEAAVAENALEELRDRCESTPPLDDNGGPLERYALPECRGTDLDFTGCPGWTLTEILRHCEDGGSYAEHFPANDLERCALHAKLLRALIDHVNRLPSL